ncbi:MAG: M48 family metallopeptidase [Phycisphaerales bacterium]|nr:M48 family metallopeptidase [Phycisphaerales bacterium]
MAQTTGARGDSRINLNGAFSGELPRRRRSPTYHLGLLATALVMVTLPLIYVALIVCIGGLVVLHAIFDVSIFSHVSGRGAIFVYLGPIVIGGTIVLLMIKPLFAPRSEEPVWVEVSRSDEPLLWGYIEQLCALVRAPVPRRIRIDCEVNASASFRRGFLSLLGSDLVLTIGLPLVAGLDLRQFTGVLAHEFGHFSQGGGMRDVRHPQDQCLVRAGGV